MANVPHQWRRPEEKKNQATFEFFYGFLAYIVQRVVNISEIYCNTKCNGKRATSRKILRSILFSPLHFVLYLEKSITVGQSTLPANPILLPEIRQCQFPRGLCYLFRLPRSSDFLFRHFISSFSGNVLFSPHFSTHCSGYEKSSSIVINLPFCMYSNPRVWAYENAPIDTEI